MTRHILIDADPLAYRAVFAKTSTSIGAVIEKIDSLFDHILDTVKEKFGEDFVVKTYLTGSNNFRKELTEDYKANRTGEKPVYLNLARQYIFDNYPCEITEGQEADDAIAIEATKRYPKAIIVSIDKDFKQVPCLLYNPSRGEWETITEKEGLKSFYTQLLVGDTVDNIKGVFKVGPVKAKAILEGATTELEMWKRCLKAYEGDYDRAVMNGRLLWLRRHENQLWTPPEG